mgnify:CR=1 FL=1
MAGLRKLNLQMANSQVTDFDDSLIVVGRNNTTDVDIGFLGRKPDNEYAGLVRDSDTANFILIETVVLENNQLNDVSALDSTVVKATLQVGTLEADNLTVVPFNDSSRTNVVVTSAENGLTTGQNVKFSTAVGTVNSATSTVSAEFLSNKIGNNAKKPNIIPTI